MSTVFRTEEKIQIADLFDGRLERLDIREHVDLGTTSEECRCLTDGRNYLWAYSARDGMLSSMSRHGQNAVGKILRAVAETFDTGIYSEHEPQFWGFANEEEWDLAWSEMDKRVRTNSTPTSLRTSKENQMISKRAPSAWDRPS